MNELAHVEAVLDVAIAALASPPHADPLHSVLPALRAAVGADAAGYYEHVRGGQTTTVEVSPIEIWRILPFVQAPTEVAAHLHPGIRHLLERSPRVPFAVTDVVSERLWWNSEIGSLMRPHWGRNHQLLLPVPPDGIGGCSRVFVLGRVQNRFTPNDRALCSRLSRILTVVALHRVAAQEELVLPGTESLTQRESLILAMANRGLTAARVGEHLGISPRTVEKHLEHAYRKLDIHSRHEAARFAPIPDSAQVQRGLT